MIEVQRQLSTYQIDPSEDTFTKTPHKGTVIGKVFTAKVSTTDSQRGFRVDARSLKQTVHVRQLVASRIHKAPVVTD